MYVCVHACLFKATSDIIIIHHYPASSIFTTIMFIITIDNYDNMIDQRPYSADIYLQNDLLKCYMYSSYDLNHMLFFFLLTGV